jgi:ABC-2 type transport system ATP-binding protein
VCNRVVILREGRVVHDQVMSDIRRGHRIRARLTAELPAVPAAMAGKLSVMQYPGGEVTIDAPGELAPLLGWLATLPLAHVNIEPIGLQAVYEQYHRADATIPALAPGFAGGSRVVKLARKPPAEPGAA